MKVKLSKEDKITFSPTSIKLATEGKNLTFEGIGTRAGIETDDYRNLTIAKSALFNQVGKKIDVFIDHEYSIHTKVGVAILSSLTAEGELLVKGELVEGATSDHIKKLMEINAQVGLSIGFSAIDYEVLDTEDGEYAGIVITQLDIFEISIVYEGAIEGSEVTKINFAKEKQEQEATKDSVEKTQDTPNTLGFFKEVKSLINGDK